MADLTIYQIRSLNNCTCPKCKSVKYVAECLTESKPTFKCIDCGNRWTFGTAGGKYARYI